jgi:tyrosine-protein phosphatase SIW14
LSAIACSEHLAPIYDAVVTKNPSDTMVDKAAMLLSTDWFAPYWSVIGIGLLVILLSIATSASPQTDQADVTPSKSFAAQHTRGQHLKAKGIRNFGQVTPTLYRGGQPSAEGFEKLAHMGINIVVDTGRSKRDETQIKNLGMAYISLPWYCPFPKDEVFARFIKITRENPGKKIFVHCRLGDDRTGMMIAAYRMGEQGWTAKEAMREMHEFGYRGVHHLMCPGLARYEKSFPGRLQNNPVFENLR